MRKLILAVTVASALAAAPVASASIVVNQSIAGVAMGMSQAQVIAALGPAKATTNATDKISGQPVAQLDYDSSYVELLGDKVVLVATTSRSEKTPNGVGVGTKEKTLRKKVKGLKCYGKKRRICGKGSGKPGTVLTTFSISKGKKVTLVVTAIVLD